VKPGDLLDDRFLLVSLEAHRCMLLVDGRLISKLIGTDARRVLQPEGYHVNDGGMLVFDDDRFKQLFELFKMMGCPTWLRMPLGGTRLQRALRPPSDKSGAQ
jgi:hypothetical protein